MIPGPAADPKTLLPRLPRWIGFIAACVGMFMAILDIQVVVTSLAVIEEALAIGADRMSWIQTAYIIAEVIAIPLTGLLMRVFSMRWLFAGALTFFTAASVGCAMSAGFADLLVWRVLQGFAGGVLIPLVFSGIFLLFPKGFEQTLATTVGGLLAVLAPALGPITGGWLTENYSWHWLFLINVIPGVVSVIAGSLSLPKAPFNTKLLRDLDWLSLIAFGIALALLVVGLKEAPKQGWLSLPVLGCYGVTAILLAFAVKRPDPAIMFGLLKDRGLAYGCVLSFLLGFILFSAVYILPVFLAFVRQHGPYTIGIITLVMGATQLIFAPFIVQIDRFFDARWLSFLGFLAFGVGLAMNADMTVNADYDEVYWPQVVRGAAVALCILPPIRFALGLVPIDKVSDASGLFNLVRNIGGVIGIAICDTIMFGRGPEHADRILQLLKTDQRQAADLLGLTVDDLPAPDDPSGLMGILDSVQNASLTMAINECWWVLAAASFLALPVILAIGPIRSAEPVKKRAESVKPAS
jgi:MFS transporter, DHA2 family, multidrug resistance protein